MTLLGIDLGTTHLKAGLFGVDGRALKIVTRPNRVRRGWRAIQSYDPEALVSEFGAMALELADWADENRDSVDRLAAIGVAGMAETGLLVERATGVTRTPLIPWFERCALEQANLLARRFDRVERFTQTGLRPGYKCGLAKLLWLKQQDPELLHGAVWLSAADYLAYRLTGRLATDYTLAERTYAFRIDERAWDQSLLPALDLPADIFPPAGAPGAVVGVVSAAWQSFRLPAGIPVAITGHDHVCGAFAALLSVGCDQDGGLFDSMGTAEALLGHFGQRALTPTDYDSGFTFGLSALPGKLYWQGGLSMSGGSLEWLRGILSETGLSYDAIRHLLEQRGKAPTGVLYFPYLAGSGSPHANAEARGAFVGLSADVGRADMIQAMLEGCAFELEWMRRKAEAVTGVTAGRVVAAGGGTRNRRWVEIKADVFNCPVDVPDLEETSLQGAALLAALGSGIIATLEEARNRVAGAQTTTYVPDDQRSRVYRRIYEQGFLKLLPAIQAAAVGDDPARL